MADVSLSNYELNKQAYITLPALSYDTIQEQVQEIVNKLQIDDSGSYVGVLCRDRHDYTIIKTNNKWNKSINEALEVLESRGEIVDTLYVPVEHYYQVGVRERRIEAIDKLEENSDFKWTPNVGMYIIFNASDGVIEA